MNSVKNDNLHRYIVKAVGYCELCGSTVNLECHHLLGGKDGNRIVRWEPALSICLCGLKCHKMTRPEIMAKVRDYLRRTDRKRLATLDYYAANIHKLEQPTTEQYTKKLMEMAEKKKKDSWYDDFGVDEVYKGRGKDGEPVFWATGK